MFDQCHHKFGIFTNNQNIFRWLYGDSLILIATFIKTNSDLIINIIANRKLTLTTISLSLLLTAYKIIKNQLLKFLFLFQSSYNLIISKKLSIVVLDDTI